MKHIVGLTRQGPRSADQIQLILCELNEVMSDFLVLKGGASPEKQFIEGKCDLTGGTS